jgi:two-component system LytT family response regulator
VKVMIIDDEPPARRELKRMLAEFPSIEVIGEAGNVAEAHEKVTTLGPDLLFLDIEMPGGSGFELLARLEQVPHVVFTTAYDAHAVRAFDVNALDYLLKPIEPARLAAAIARIRNVSALTPMSDAIERLFIRDGARCWFVPVKEVRLFTAEGNYVRVFWNSETPLLGRSLTGLEQRLDPKKFFRGNRRQIINLDFVESLELGDGGRLHVQLKGGPEVEISRRQARLFKERG